MRKRSKESLDADDVTFVKDDVVLKWRRNEIRNAWGFCDVTNAIEMDYGLSTLDVFGGNESKDSLTGVQTMPRDRESGRKSHSMSLSREGRAEEKEMLPIGVVTQKFSHVFIR